MEAKQTQKRKSQKKEKSMIPLYKFQNLAELKNIIFGNAYKNSKIMKKRKVMVSQNQDNFSNRWGLEQSGGDDKRGPYTDDSSGLLRHWQCSFSETEWLEHV